MVVCSAHKGMTNALIAAAREAANGRFNPKPVIEKQRAIAAELGCPSTMLDEFYTEITDLLRGLSLVKGLHPLARLRVELRRADERAVHRGLFHPPGDARRGV